MRFIIKLERTGSTGTRTITKQFCLDNGIGVAGRSVVDSSTSLDGYPVIELDSEEALILKLKNSRVRLYAYDNGRYD
jgi:hypothetical protein